MPILDCRGLPVALLALFCCPGSGKEFEVYIWPENLVVEPSESWEVNCSTTCLQPQKGGLEGPVNKTLLDKQPQWNLFLLSNISQDTYILCYFTCSGKQEHKRLNISVYHPPKEVTLKLQPTWVTVGRLFTIECRVPAVKPLENLTLTLFHGKEILHHQTFAGGTLDPQEATATLNITAPSGDKHHNFSCQAELDLRSHGGGIIRRVSETKMLEVYEPMQDSQMIIIVTVVSVLLFLFVTSVLLCFVFGQHWRQRRTGTYGVQA
ncbi:intercellular adhesion molecule 2 isoform X2 [Tupaia chinensis]|uniref:Intercellular adhesion molecule 2 n=2 Tax=Tupaia chinensis TaxID=246437 RepID=L9KX62_TUPCH|nr:intercellular adhesion molecule 2 isoform X2 [Tupaia chinensis]ELW67495.1 Intercellular adhesion molecule 2 [Tupaia chinensis]